MKLFTEIFNCRYPIVAMAMNQVSDLPLARAVRKAGALPSLSVFNYLVPINAASTSDALNDMKVVPDRLENDLENYHREFGDCHMLLSLNLASLLDDKIYKMILKYKVKALELITIDAPPRGQIVDDDTQSKIFNERCNAIKDNETLLFRKIMKGVLPPSAGSSLWSKIHLHGFIVKGPDGAGHGPTDGTPLEESCSILKSRFPDKPFIPSGGIGTSEQVLWHMSNGAFAVGVGTVLAACQESKISEATKLKMVAASSADLSKLSSSARLPFSTAQNALVFSRSETISANNTYGLKEGIKDPSRGHVFAGKAIDQVTEILPAAEIIQRLAKDL